MSADQKFWTAEDDRILTEMWNGLHTAKHIAEQLGRKTRDVFWRRYHLDLITEQERKKARMNDPAFKDQFKALYLQGIVAVDICRQLGITYHHMDRMIEELDLPTRKRGKPRRHTSRPWRRYSDEVIEEIRQRRAKNQTPDQIATEMQIDYHAVSSILDRYRLDRGTRQRWNHDEDLKMTTLLDYGQSTYEIGRALGRTECGVVSRICKLGLRDKYPHVKSVPAFAKPNASLRTVLKSKLAAIKSREIHACDLTLEDLLDLHDKQGGKCYYTGFPLALQRKDPNTISIERLDLGRHYCLDNVVLCIWDANKMKDTLSLDRFLELCKAIAAHRGSQ